MRFLLRLLVTATALWVAVSIIPGLDYNGPRAGLLLVALVFGLVNALVRPVLFLLTCPLILLTLGLFIFVLNGMMLWLTGLVAAGLGLEFVIEGFGSAFLGALVVGAVSTVLNVFVGAEVEED